jgi:hypothetical protein
MRISRLLQLILAAGALGVASLSTPSALAASHQAMKHCPKHHAMSHHTMNHCHKPHAMTHG